MNSTMRPVRIAAMQLRKHWNLAYGWVADNREQDKKRQGGRLTAIAFFAFFLHLAPPHPATQNLPTLKQNDFLVHFHIPLLLLQYSNGQGLAHRYVDGHQNTH